MSLELDSKPGTVPMSWFEFTSIEVNTQLRPTAEGMVPVNELFRAQKIRN
jgi:hypothetical protein